MRRRDYLCWACLLLVLVSSTASAETLPFTPQDVMRVQTVIDVSIAPDGQHIGYVLAVPRDPFTEADGPAHRELHVVDREGNSRPFITGRVQVRGLRWLPDSSAMVFLLRREGDTAPSLHRIALHGGEAERLLPSSAGVRSYSLSPDGASIAFVKGGASDNGAAAARTRGFNHEIYEEDRGLGIAKTVTLGDTPASAAEGIRARVSGAALAVAWSPGNDRLAVVTAPTALIDDRYMRPTVSLVDLEEGQVVASIEHQGKLGQVVWSPDGEHLAMVAAVDQHDPMQGRIRVAPKSGGAGQLLLKEAALHVRSLVWRDARRLVYVADEGVQTTVGEIALDGTAHRILLQGAAPMTRISLTADGDTWATLGESARHPREVFVGQLDHLAPQRLTHHNRWLQQRTFGRQEVVTFADRTGELELQGILIHPSRPAPDDARPLVVQVHGGPESHVRNGWLTSYSALGQLGASRGFAVFYPNYRGSTGRGVAFSQLGQSDAAGAEFDDLVDGVEAMIERGVADRRRVGITGVSYGGYASAWAATRFTEHFAAAVMFAGISNKVAKSGTTDIPNEEFLVHTRRRPWEHWDWLWERSPLRYVADARTPLLIAHGKNDTRVHPSEAMQIYRHFREIGRSPVRLVLYPNEGHGHRRAAARLDYCLRLLRWMETWLLTETPQLPPMAVSYPESQ